MPGWMDEWSGWHFPRCAPVETRLGVGVGRESLCRGMDRSPAQRAQSQGPSKVQSQVCLITANPGASFKTCPGGRGGGEWES